jgi:xylono-1,5-lactonase
MILNQLECIWNGHAELAEGPLWSQREQALYWVDILGHRLHRHSVRDGQRHWHFDQEVSAVAERMHGPELLISQRHSLAFFEPEEERLIPLIRIEGGIPANRLNDGKCDARGRFWAGSMDFEAKAPRGALYRIEPNLECSRMDSGYPVTNGPTWSLDGRTMYFNDSTHGRVYAFDFDADTGAVSGKRLFLQLSDAEGAPDGMTTDAEGGLWIAHWGAGKLTRRDASGRVLRTIDVPCSQVSSCTFGGTDLRTLFITTAAVGLSQRQLEQEPLAGGLFAIHLDVAGMPANLFGG